jgi:hypothetical protein
MSRTIPVLESALPIISERAYHLGMYGEDLWGGVLLVSVPDGEDLLALYSLRSGQ